MPELNKACQENDVLRGVGRNDSCSQLLKMRYPGAENNESQEQYTDKVRKSKQNGPQFQQINTSQS